MSIIFGCRFVLDMLCIVYVIILYRSRSVVLAGCCKNEADIIVEKILRQVQAYFLSVFVHLILSLLP